MYYEVEALSERLIEALALAEDLQQAARDESTDYVNRSIRCIKHIRRALEALGYESD